MPGFAPGGLTLSSTLPPFAVEPRRVRVPAVAVGVHVRARALQHDRSGHPDAVRPQLDHRPTARALAERGDRDPLRRQPRAQPVALLRLQRSEHLRERLPEEFRNAQRNLAINMANGRTGFANNGLAGQVGAADLRGRVRSARLAGALPAATAGYTNGTFITQLQQGQAGALADTLAGRATRISAGSSATACRRATRSATTRRACSRSTSSRRTRTRPGTPSGCSPTKPGPSTTALQLQFRQRYHNGISLTAQLHLRQGAHRSLRRLRVGRRGLHHAARQAPELGADVYDIRARVPELLDL